VLRRSDLSGVKVAFASGSASQNQELVDRLAKQAPQVPLYVVAEFQPGQGEWIPWHVLRSYRDNLDSVRAALQGREIVSAGLVLSRGVPLSRMRLAALFLAGSRLTVWDEAGREFSAFALPAVLLFRAAQTAGSQLASGGRTRKWLRRLAHPSEAEIPLRARAAQALGVALGNRRSSREAAPLPGTEPLASGVSVVIPSRDGRELLAAILPGLEPQIGSGEIIVSDNGSSDSTSEWLAESYPRIRVILTTEPLSFARAVNLGIAAARYDHVILLNNDMVVEPGFVGALETAFGREADVFCTTAQIFFPEGVRREETGKAVWRQEQPLDFPLRCDEPLPGEDSTWVLYGSGGCSLYDTAKLRALGGVSQWYDPAYVEDLDLGYRAWKRGWPSLYCAEARVEHRHRATTSRFYTPEQLEALVERNYLVFLIHAIGSPALFQRLWREAIRRVQLLAMNGSEAALAVLRTLPKISPRPGESTGPLTEDEILALGCGDIAVFPGTATAASQGGTIAVCSPFLPFPLSHGGAVRIFNLMTQTAQEWDQVLVAFADELTSPPADLLRVCREIVVVRRHHSHYRRDTERPDTVEEFDSLPFRAALKQTVQRWNPAVVQLEFTQMAQYAPAASPAKTVLVEHDITFDLQEQLLRTNPDWEREQQLVKWLSFETQAWRDVDCVVAMSAKDQKTAATTARMAISLPNGVDTNRFSPAPDAPEAQRLLFIGSFAHLPNLLALDFFLREVWPLLEPGFRLHVIAGSRPEYYLEFFRSQVNLDLTLPGIEVEGFVADVRPAYRQASLVLAPLTASAGTNIKVLEAMAMGRAVVATPAGINGLDLSAESSVAVGRTAGELAGLIEKLSADPELRRKYEQAARTTALAFDWREIGKRQSELYRSIQRQSPLSAP
jgi:GT2 family glycosyltransferase/glycosyltransferase involved in cell wall biosynthesis